MKKVKKKTPKFSVITVVKNDKFKISNTIKSVLNQTYKNFEYIVVDGKSTDGTLRIISKYKKKINSLISRSDDGIYFAMNKGIKISKGEIIVFINSGDLFSKNALKVVSNLFKKNKSFDFVFGTVKRHYTKSTIVKYGFNTNRLKYNFDFATAHSTGFFVKRNEIIKAGLFNTKYKCSADYDLYYKLLIKRNLKGTFSKKKDLVGEVMPGGFSSKISFFEHMIEEVRIRYNNKQNLFIIFIIIINTFIKHLLKILF